LRCGRGWLPRGIVTAAQGGAAAKTLLAGWGVSGSAAPAGMDAARRISARMMPGYEHAVLVAGGGIANAGKRTATAKTLSRERLFPVG